MTIPVANVDITTDTFGTWVIKTNTLAYQMSNYVVTVDKTSSGNGSVGNGYVVGNFGSTILFANSSLRGGNVSTTGTLNISSNVSLSNTITITGASVLSNTLTTVGNVNFSNTLVVTGNVSLSNTLVVTGAANVIGSFTVTGATTLRNTLLVNNALTAANTLTVTGLSALNGNVNTPTANATTAINVGANANINTTSFKITGGVSNTIITNNNITVGNSTVNTSITPTAITTDGTLFVTGLTTLSANLAVTGNAVFSNSITVSKSATLSNTLDVTGVTTLSNTLNVIGPTNLTGSVTANGTTFIANTFTVTGLANLNVGINTTTINASLINVGENTYINTTTFRVGNSTTTSIIGNNYILVGNSTVNSVMTATSFNGTSNNSVYLNGQSATYYTNATNINSGTLNTARLPATANIATAINVGANVNIVTDRITVSRGTNSIYAVANSTVTQFSVGNTFSNSTTFVADYINVRGDLNVNGNFYVSATLTANGSLVPSANILYDLGTSEKYFNSLYVLNVFSNTSTHTSYISVGNTTVNSTVNSTSFSGTSNNAANFDGQPSSFYANADNITSGTLNSARLESTVSIEDQLFVGANVYLSNSRLKIGNSSVNTVISAIQVSTDGILTVESTATLGSSLSVAGLSSLDGNLNTPVVNATTINATTVTSNNITVGANVVLSTGSLTIGNSTVNTVMNSTSFNGRANTANTLTTARNFSITGDVVAPNVSFNGSSIVTLNTTLANSGVTAGEYTKVNVDSKGRVTNGAYIANTDVVSALGYTPANKAGDTFTGNTSYSANLVVSPTGSLIVQAGAGFIANGSLGGVATVLHSNGSSVYWGADDQGVTSVSSGNGITGGTITTTGTLSILANTGLVANATGLHVIANNGLIANSSGLIVHANTGLVANTSGLHVNSTYIGTLRANTANTLTTARNFSITGDVVAPAISFNGSAVVSLSATLANSGVTAGQYTKVNVDSKGRVTNGAYIASGDVVSALGYTPLTANSSATVDGNFFIDGTATPRSLIINTSDPRQRGIFSRTGGVNRWGIIFDGAAETGNNAGSNFSISRYDDTGSISSVMSINRLTGNYNFGLGASITDTKIRITADTTNEHANAIQIMNSNDSTRASASIRFHSGGGGGYRASIRGGRSASSLSDGELVFFVGDNSAELEALRLDSDKSASFYGNMSTNATSINIGSGTSGEKRVHLHNNVRQVYYYLDTSGNAGLYDASAGTYKWGSNTSHGFSVPSNLSAGGNVNGVSLSGTYITSSGNIDATSGTVSAVNLNASSNISAGSSVSAVNISSTGSTTSPNYFFSGDTDTGITSGGSGSIRFLGNGVNIGTFDTSQLQVYNNSSGSSAILHNSGFAVFNTAGSPDGFAFNVFSRDGVTIGSISQTGSATQVNYNTTSDYRLKTDVKPVLNASETLMKLKVYNHSWKASPTYFQDGFLAHELQEHIPYAVTGKKDAVDENGNIVIQQVDYSKVVPLLTASLQEALMRISELEKKLETK